MFGAYRYRTWNGSLGETDVYSSTGWFHRAEKGLRVGQVEQLLHLAVGVGNYQADSFTNTNLTESLRANFYGSINSVYPIWRGRSSTFDP